MAIDEQKEKLISKYSDKILGIRNYPSEKNEFFVKDFIEMDTLHEFLGEVFTGESDITPAGKSFLEKYYGFEQLASDVYKIVSSTAVSEFSENNLKEIMEIIRNMEPMVTRRFIEEARENIKEGATLHSDLLPPED